MHIAHRRRNETTSVDAPALANQDRRNGTRGTSGRTTRRTDRWTGVIHAARNRKSGPTERHSGTSGKVTRRTDRRTGVIDVADWTAVEGTSGNDRAHPGHEDSHRPLRIYDGPRRKPDGDHAEGRRMPAGARGARRRGDKRNAGPPRTRYRTTTNLLSGHYRTAANPLPDYRKPVTRPPRTRYRPLQDRRRTAAGP